jgi:uncharacterized 2Fe-2S/4Fe-4S cluster protein (DUF4445 family)
VLPSFGEDAVIRLYRVRVAEPDIHDPASDARRLEAALAKDHGLFGVEIPLPVLAVLQKTLRQGGWHVTVAVNGRRIVAIYPEDCPSLYGVAFDVGASVIEAVLIDLATGQDVSTTSIVNPLVRFGADPITRIAYGMNTSNGVQEMCDALRQGLDQAISILIQDHAVSRTHLVDATFVASPVCHHLVLGLDPYELGAAPFTEAVSEALLCPAHELGLGMAPGALVYALPLAGHHVGSDTVASAFACGLAKCDRVTVMIDLGTTTEIAVASQGKVYAALSPAGGVFEGVGLEAGRHAVTGAIATLRIDPASGEPSFKVIGSDLWSDHKDFTASVEALDLGGLCRSGLIDALAELRLSGLMGRDGALNSARQGACQFLQEEYRSLTYLIRDKEPRLAVTQHDIRALQLAKASVQASIRILLQWLGVTAPERIILTCGSGPALDPLRAAVIGLFPDCDPADVIFIANAALDGVKRAICHRSIRHEIVDLARRMRVVETVLDPAFAMEQIGAMGFPHATRAYDKTGAAILIPDNEATERGRRAGRRTR